MIADDLEDPLLRRPSIVRSKGRLLDTDSRPSGVWEAPRQVLGRLRRLARTTLHLFHPPHVPETSTSSPQRDDHVTTPFEDSFMKLLTGAQYNLDTVGPYARLHLTVHGASRLLAQDYCGTSDPYVEVYVNDIKRGQSRHVNFTLNPQWNFSEVVDIWSPFSIITLRIVDWDRVSQDGPIGFVDFCVADLEPNAPGVRGWLELRKMKRFQSNAKKRFLEHRRLRDDAISDEEVEEDQVQEEAALSPSTMGGFSPSHAAQHAAHAAHHAAHAAQHAAHHAAQHAKQALKRRISSFHLAERQAKLKTTMKLMRGRATRVPRMPCCSGDPKDEDQAAASRRRLSFRRRRKALNAGEVDVSLRLETTCRSLVAKTGVGQPELLYTAVLAPERIREVVKDAEWFACCLPEPAFREQLVSSLGSIKLFAEEVIELLEMLLQVLIIPHVNIVLLIIGWYYKSLSLASLLYFWALIYWCSDMLWTLPLFVLVLFVLLRDRICSNWLLAHPKVVPLNQDGFEMVAFLQNSGGMAVWLKRLVKDRGGWIEDTPELKEFAKRLHHNGKPVLKFPDLLKSLEEKDKTWISWQGKPKKCPHCGQVLEFWGNGAIRLDDGWCCYGLRSKNEDGSRNGRVCAAGLHLSRKQHLGRQRYHCTRCADRASEEELAPGDMCGVCARGGRAYYIASLLKTLNQLPIWRTLLMKAIKEFISDTGPLLEYAQALTKRLLRLMDFLRDPHNDELFKSVCFACISTSMVLYVLNYFLGDLLFTFLLYLLRLGLWIVGTGTFLLFTPPVRRLRTAHNATRLLARCYRWRDRGGCRRWKFFRPSEGEFARPYLRINSVETLDGSDRLFPLSPYGRG